MNKVALITGGSRGIGLGIANALAKEGFNLAINGVRSEEEVNSLSGLEKYNTKVLYVQGNVGLNEDRQKIVKEVIESFGHINVLVNNAGVAPLERSDLLQMSEESYDRVMDINLKGAVFLTQAVALQMVRNKSENQQFIGYIINISSISATMASPNRAEYCISKSGMSMMTRLFATRLGKDGIPVYEVRPGIIRTDMTAGVTQKYDQLIQDGLTIQPSWGTSRDVGMAVASMVRGDFPYSTGQVFMVDGGLTIPRL